MSFHCKSCHSFAAHRWLRYHLKLDSVVRTLGIKKGVPPRKEGSTGALKNKFTDYSVFSCIDTGLECLTVQPLVFDLLPGAQFSHSQSGCYAAAQIGGDGCDLWESR